MTPTKWSRCYVCGLAHDFSEKECAARLQADIDRGELERQREAGSWRCSLCHRRRSENCGCRVGFFHEDDPSRWERV